jgi:choline dehydrogenase-like flavoprotein
MYYVIGSGPAGVAAASALVDRGLRVTMLDVGRECEPDRLELARSMSMRAPEEWTADDVRTLRGNGAGRDADPFPIKRTFGSAFAYADDPQLSQINTSCLQSQAKGGLSNVWGAAVLPNIAADLDGWPISLDELKPHYAHVARLMPIAGHPDDLQALFPFYDPPRPALRPSRLAAATLERMERHRGRLLTAGLRFGRSRLAVDTADTSDRRCRYSSLCLSGCPYFAIWSSAAALDSMLRCRPNFTYQPGWYVERIEPAAGGVRLRARSSDSREQTSFDGRRAFVACGPVSTLRLVIDSLGAYGHTFLLQFQPYFLLPLVAFESSGNVERERLHTLAQVFLELNDRSVSPHTVHLQVYTFNELMRERVSRAISWLGPLRAAAGRTVLGRLMAIQGYLHSSEAAPIRVTSAHEPGSRGARLTLTAEPDPRVRLIVDRVRRVLRRQARAIGAMPVARLQQIGRPGDGNHVGAALPMRKAPGMFETDVEGQLAQLPNVHFVDAISLPSLAATTFTYTTMANAHRIADAVASRE